MSEPPDRAATNGEVPKPAAGGDKRRSTRRGLLVAGLVLFLGFWTFAIIYSVTAGGRSPERLDDPNARTVESTCRHTQRELSALPQVGVHAPAADRATRIADEDKVLLVMVNRLRGVHPRQATPATALTGWLDDWQRLVTAREHYVSDLRTRGNAARFIEPATKGVDPIADKMNSWILEQGTRTNSCNTGQLQAEVVAGPRTYGPESKS